MTGPQASDEQTATRGKAGGNHEPAPDRDAGLVLLPGGRQGDSPAPDREADGIRLRHVIGATLRAERQRQGRTLADVAREAAVSLPYLSEVERGRKEISSDLLHSVHRTLGLELDEVLERAAQRLRARSQRGRPMLLAA